MDIIKNSLREYLESTGETPLAFAVRSKIPQKTIYNIVRRNTKPQTKTAERICRATKGVLALKDFGR